MLDVVFREDELNIIDATGATHITLINRVSMALLKQNKSKDSMRSKRNRAGWNSEFREQLLFG